MYYLGVEDDGYPRGLNDQDLAGQSRLVCLVNPPVRQHLMQGRSAGGEPELACCKCTQCCAHIAVPLITKHMCSLQAVRFQAVTAASTSMNPCSSPKGAPIFLRFLLQSLWPAWLPWLKRLRRGRPCRRYYRGHERASVQWCRSCACARRMWGTQTCASQVWKGRWSAVAPRGQVLVRVWVVPLCQGSGGYTDQHSTDEARLPARCRLVSSKCWVMGGQPVLLVST